MKILVVDDSVSKREAVCGIIGKILPGAQITVAVSFVEAVRALEDTSYELLLLDLVLPTRVGEDPRLDNGVAILREIFDDGSVNPPNHVVCLSEYEKALEGLRDEAQRRLVHLVKYSEHDSAWSEILSSKLSYVSRRVEKANRFPLDYLVDVAVVASYPIVELRAVLELGVQMGAEFHKQDELHYYHATWQGVDKPLKVVACAAPTMGMTAACTTAMKMISRWRPRYLVMTGIAAGTNGDLKFGDVLVSECCYDYGSGKIIDREGTKDFMPSPQQIPVDTDLKALLQRWESSQEGMVGIGKLWKHDGTFVPKLCLGVIATGAAVIQSSRFVDEIKEHSRKVVGLEMEAFGVCQAGRHATHPRPKVLIAKSVSDFADSEKRDDSQMLAAFTSAQFAYKFFTTESDLF